MPLQIPPEASEAAPGVIGALISVLFLKGPKQLIAGMSCGGAALAYYGANVLAVWLSSPGAAGLFGFLIGLFGMSVAAKVYEAIQAFAAGDIGKTFIDWLRKQLGVSP